VKDQEKRTAEIFLAGGCFWGLEKVYSGIKGAIHTECGYANGYDLIIPDYMTVCSGKFGYCEVVKIIYDPEIVSLEKLLEVFFMVIDPTLLNRQGGDRGIQYRTGIYWTDEGSATIVSSFVEKEKKKHEEFFTESGPLINYFKAEEYHQKYLDKNPNGYCHIPRNEIEQIHRMFSGQ